MEYIFHVLILVCLYCILATSLDLIVGKAGMVSIAHGAFYGLGAYTSALLVLHLGVPFYVGLAGGMLLAAAASFLVSLPSLRLHEDYFVIATFGFQMIIFNILNNWMGLTRGPLGIPGIPQPAVLGWKLQSPGLFLVLVAVFAVVAYVTVRQIDISPFGRVLRAIREDEIFAKALGKNTVTFKTSAFATSAALAGLAGGLYAHYMTFIDPTSFTVMESILVISMVVIGGADSMWGPVVGAVTLVTVPEVLRFIGISSSVAANLRQIFYGSLLVAIMMFRPRGLLGRYGFGR